MLVATRREASLRRDLGTLFHLGAIRDLTDGQLLERFETAPGEAADLAFAALVDRHAALVLRTCQARLRDPEDARDAFQAVFLILIKKARSLWVRDSLGPWLHQVAHRTARGAGAALARRRRVEREAAARASGTFADESAGESDWERSLHEEIDRLPDRYRVAIVLCDLQGRSCEEAARMMGRPIGTVKCWRSRGRERLRGRLSRLGIIPATGGIAALASDAAWAAAVRTRPDAGVGPAVRALRDGMTAGTVPAVVEPLVNGVIRIMILHKARTTLAATIAMAALASGLAAMARAVAPEDDTTPPIAAGAAKPGEPAPGPKPSAEQIRELTLPDAIRIGLRNSDVVRVIEPPKGSPDAFVIALNQGDRDPYQFRSELMAHVRSVEQQYWALSLARVQHGAAESAVDLGEQLLEREEAKLKVGGSDANIVAEAREQLERFRLDFVDKTANLLNTERQLRNIVGLPAKDGTRLVPVTPALEEKLEPDWEESLAAMVTNLPDLVRADDLMAKAKREGVDPAGLESQRQTNRQLLQESTHNLARFFLELDADHKLYRTASRLREAAKQRLDAQAAFHEQGKITVDRHLDAVNRWATSITQEADFLMRYNTAIAALEEAKGTLLEHEKITVSEANAPAETRVAGERRDTEVRPASLIPPIEEPTPARPTPAGKTYSFQLSIGPVARPFEIRGSFTLPAADTP